MALDLKEMKDKIQNTNEVNLKIRGNTIVLSRRCILLLIAVFCLIIIGIACLVHLSRLDDKFTGIFLGQGFKVVKTVFADLFTKRDGRTLGEIYRKFLINGFLGCLFGIIALGGLVFAEIKDKKIPFSRGIPLLVAILNCDIWVFSASSLNFFPSLASIGCLIVCSLYLKKDKKMNSKATQEPVVVETESNEVTEEPQEETSDLSE